VYRWGGKKKESSLENSKIALVGGVKNVTQIASGKSHNAAITNEGKLVTRDYNLW
jgi:alpha-tubulin suppressor-like RCC1 family protein